MGLNSGKKYYGCEPPTLKQAVKIALYVDNKIVLGAVVKGKVES